MSSIRTWIRFWVVILALVTVSAGWAPTGLAAPDQPPDAATLQDQMQQLIDYVDGPDYAAAVSWDEHVVLAYRLAQGRDPSPLEFALLKGMSDQIGYTRSAVLSSALRGNEPRPTWELCRVFAARVAPEDFAVDAEVTESARRLAAVPPQDIAQTAAAQEAAEVADSVAPVSTQTPNVAYNTYFGYLHAHSGLSDGTGTPLEAYTYARDAGDLDFFALTDHGEFLMLWPWDTGWDSLKAAAEATNEPGTFAALWGFEWSNPFLGHLNVINSADYTDAVSNYPLTGLYNWLVARPDAFGLFNHPGQYDSLGTEFSHLKRFAAAVPQVVGIETWNGNSSFDEFVYNGGYGTRFGYQDVGNRKGWYLGASGAQDNHNVDWGTMNQFRIAVLAEGLTRDQVVDAYRNRRFYATEDKDLKLDLRCQGFPMGSRLSGGPRQFVVSGCDGSGDTFVEVRWYRNGTLARTKSVSGNCFQVVFSDPNTTGKAYYYVIVRQADDNDGNGRNDEAISSPIWFE